ncbi:MAG TPA: SRPBCC domain-containing protein [Rubrobacter sp.]|nr:SRPBCC domain-containing protein [Rubrobacter sp.]
MAAGDDPRPGELVVTRDFDAPRELVFRAWTEPERVRRWWGPEGFTMPYCDIDLRPGGTFLRCMRAPGGLDFWVTGVFREIVAPELLVFTDSFADKEGNVVPPTRYGAGSGMPLERLVTVTFEELAGSTRVTVRHAGLPSGEDRDLVRHGWAGGLESLSGYLSGAS